MRLHCLAKMLAKQCTLILPEDDFEIKPKYYCFNHFLFLTRVLSLQDVVLRNMFYFVFYQTVVRSRLYGIRISF